MSVVLGIKYKDGVILAGDKQLTKGYTKEHEDKSFKKIYQTQYSNIGFGGVGSGRISNVLETMDDPVPLSDIFIDKKEINRIYIIKNIVPILFDTFRKNNCIIKNSDGIEELNGRLLICTKDEIMVMDAIGCVFSSKNYAAIGAGEDLVSGYLNTFKNTDFNNFTEEQAIQIAKKAIIESCKDNITINNKVDIIVLKK